MPANIRWDGGVVPWVKPVVIMAAIPPTIAIRQFRVIVLHAAVGLANDNPCPTHAQLIPDPVDLAAGGVRLLVLRRPDDAAFVSLSAAEAAFVTGAAYDIDGGVLAMR